MSGDAELHRRAKQVVLDALEQPRSRRASFIARRCGSDSRLLTEVESLLALDDSADGFLERPPIELAASASGFTTLRSASQSPALEPGDVAAERFEIVRVLGEGGMGVVYEALDRASDETVALKVMRSRGSSAADVRQWTDRFKREVQLARRVTHRNVCRIFDIFQQQPVSESEVGAADEQWMLSMELLRGDSLAAHLQENGPLLERDAENILRQLVAGLQAAHDAGVVHRDFKTSNVMLVPDATAPGGLRAVVTDFGIARSTREEPEADASLTRTGQMMGTPLYMAPEQILGREVSPATDIYSLGVVLFEMLCGQRPFDGTSALSAAAQRFTEDPRLITETRDELSPRFRSILSRCLERDPADRYARAEDVLTALDGGRVSGRRGQRARARRRATLLSVLTATSLIAGVALLWWLGWIGPRGDVPSAAEGLRPTIAVLELDNAGQDASRNWWSVAVAEMLIAELEAGGKANVVAGSRAADVARELLQSESRTGLERVAAALDARFLLTGSYTALDDSGNARVRLDLDLLDMSAQNTTPASIVELGSEAELSELVARAAARARDLLGIDAPPASERQRALVRFASSSAAAEAYARGLDARRRFDARSAVEHFERAIAIEPAYALAHLELANAWAELGFETRALAAARTAYELRAPLQRQDQLWVEGRYATLSRDWQRAAELYRALWTVFPDRVDFGITLAEVQIGAGDGEAALATVDQIRQLEAAGVDPSVDLVEGAAAWAMGDWPRHLEASERAQERARQLGLRGREAQALCEVGWARRYAGELAEAIEAGESCLDIWSELGNPGEEANALNFIATVQLDRGRSLEAATSYEEAANRFQAMGNLGGVAVAYSNLGNARYDLGQLEAARELYTQALDLFSQIGRQEGVSMMHNALGNVALSMLQIDQALENYSLASETSRTLGSKRALALALNNLGNTYLQLGDLKQAQSSFEESQTLCLELDHRRLQGYNLWGLGEVDAARGDFESARRAHRSALKLRIENGETSTAEESRLALAWLDLYDGEAEKALEQARAASEAFRELGALSNQSAALALLARAQLALGELASAQQSAVMARDLVGFGSRAQQLGADLALGLVELKQDGRRERLGSVAGEARRSKLLPLQLEAECTLAPEASAAERAKALGLVRLEKLCRG